MFIEHTLHARHCSMIFILIYLDDLRTSGGSYYHYPHNEDENPEI